MKLPFSDYYVEVDNTSDDSYQSKLTGPDMNS